MRVFGLLLSAWQKGFGFRAMGGMDALVVPVIYHGGRLERLATGELCYLGGEVKKHEAIDVDFVNKEDLLLQVRDLGYTEFKRLLWHDPTQIHFEDGLHLLAGNTDVNDMCVFTLNHNLKEFHIYIDHVVNVPLPADASVVISSDFHSSRLFIMFISVGGA
ncbi:hypothetical protein PIB30_047921 [Stylosanthes scabra]|uniref:PB1-like domain-containing protein n=1 Tax=Stylosanthes scabra TaxID=79078 RepID=A0ABU6UG86_9FABA|nr:hypothetical protein [Stylosanthes scabra]